MSSGFARGSLDGTFLEIAFNEGVIKHWCPLLGEAAEAALMAAALKKHVHFLGSLGLVV